MIDVDFRRRQILRGLWGSVFLLALTSGGVAWGDETPEDVTPRRLEDLFDRARDPSSQATLRIVNDAEQALCGVHVASDDEPPDARTPSPSWQTPPASAVRDRASRAGILHLAAHGALEAGEPLFSALLLSGDKEHDGRLEVHEISRLDLGATDLVVLSACQTQVGQRSNGDEVIALNRAFLNAGARSVIASLWSVDDEATARLMIDLHGHLRAGLPKAEALRRAQQSLRTLYPDPYYWAPFVLVGGRGPVASISQE